MDEDCDNQPSTREFETRFHGGIVCDSGSGWPAWAQSELAMAKAKLGLFTWKKEKANAFNERNR